MKWYQTWRWEAPPWEHHQGADTPSHQPLATVLVTVTWSPDLLISWPLSWSQWPTWDMWRSMAWSLTSDWFRVVTWPRLWPLIGRRPSSTLIGRAGGSCGSRGTSQVGELSWQLLSRHPDMRSRQKYSGNYFYCVCFQYNDYKLTYSHIIENFQRNYSWWKTFSLPKNMM